MPKRKPQPQLVPSPSMLSLMLPLPTDLVRTAGTSLALVGAADTQRTALLLQAAIRLVTVTDPDAAVLVLAVQQISIRPHTVHQMPAVVRDNAHLVHFHFFSSSGDLIQYLADYHQKETYPRAIVIDDLHIFTQRKFVWGQEYEPQTIACKILTLARELTAFCGQQSGRLCYLLVGSEEAVCIRPPPKTVTPVPADSKFQPPELTESLIPILNTFVENVILLKRHEESETTDQTNIHMDFGNNHIRLYVQGKQIYVDRVEEDQMLPIPKAASPVEPVPRTD